MSVQNSSSVVFPVPVGVILPYCGIIAPFGFLLCDGTAYNNSDFPELNQVLGGIYGSTPTTFSVPDLVGNFITGTAVNANVINPASSSGETSSFTLTTAQIPTFATNTTNSAPVFNVNTDGHPLLIAMNEVAQQAGGSPTQTFYGGQNVETQPAPVITAQSYTTAFNNATQVAVTLTASNAIPANYTFQYIIRATTF